MDINLLRYDLLTTSSTSRNCMRILPLGTKSKQKIVIGDSTGFIQGFSLGKAQELITSFRVNPLPPGQPVKPVNGLDLNGDKIFVALGEVITGITKKGKDFFRLETNFSEPILNMTVRTPFIWTAGEYVLNVFEEGREIQFYMCPDKINHLVVEHVSTDKAFDSILACNDRMIRVIKNGELLSEHNVDAAVSTVSIYSSRNLAGHELNFGTSSGHLGAYKINPQGLTPKWSKADSTSTGGIGGFNSIVAWDFLRDGTSQMITGRDNGIFEIYGFDASATEPHLLYQTSLNESITAIDCGFITNNVRDDIAVSTYSGKVLAFSDYHQPGIESSSMGFGAAAATREMSRKKNEKRVQTLQSEIDKLKERLSKKKEEYSRLSEDHIAVSADYKLKEKFTLDASAALILTIELDCPIEKVALQSDVDVELLDVDTNAAIVSRTVPEKDSASKLLASYRNAEPVNRMEIKMRTVEGQSGTLQAFVLPTLTPKTATLVTCQVRPLSLHQRLAEKPAGVDDLLMNSLTFEGKFSLSDMNSWISQCMPDVPERTQTDEVTYYFRSTFQLTTLIAKFAPNFGTFKSDSVSTLSVIKDFITKLATARKIQIKSTFDIKDETCANVLTLLHPKLQYQLGLSEKVKLIEALKEIEMQEQDVSFMSEQYKDILSRAKQIEKEFEQQPRRLEFLFGIVKALYMDKFKFKGQNVAHKLPVLQGKLEKYDLKEIKDFFNQSV